MPLAIGNGIGVSFGGRVAFSPASLFSGGVQGGWYDPSDLSTLFQDTAGTTPVTADGQSVARINDKSGNGNHLLQATVANRPLYKTSAGLHWLEFDGVNDLLAAAFALAQPWDRVSAIRQISWTTTRRIYSGSTAADGLLLQSGVTPAIILYNGLGAPSSSGLAVGTNGVVTERHNGASSQIAINNGAYVTGDSGAAATGGLAVGASATGGEPSNIRWYGATMRGVLTAGQIDSLRQYYAAKAGVTL